MPPEEKNAAPPRSCGIESVPSPMLKGFRIGDLTLRSPLILAPLAGISDLPYRMLNRRFGAELAFVEMISARSLVYQSRQTLGMLATAAGDRPLGIQLLGSDPGILKRAVGLLRDIPFDVLDLNAACPVNKVTSRGEGAGMLKTPDRIGHAVEALAAVSPVPVTIKMRIGWDADSIAAAEVASNAESAGAQAIFIHGRTREQGYAGAVWYDMIGSVKHAVSIPVIASGDALSPRLIKRLFLETRCDGVAIARGALGNPWIFPDTERFFSEGSEPTRPPLPGILSIMRDHIQMLCEHYGEHHGVIVFRKFFAWYAKGFRNIRPLKQRVFTVSTRGELLSILADIEAAGPEVLPLYESYSSLP